MSDMLNVSTKVQYGLRAMAHLASRGPSTCAEIAEAERIPHKYLEGILTSLKQAGLVLSERGKGGGFSLAERSDHVSILRIVSALEGEVVPVDCVARQEACGQGSSCKPRLLWAGLKRVVDDYLESRTLRDIS
jgi:Rrf2 family protein